MRKAAAVRRIGLALLGASGLPGAISCASSGVSYSGSTTPKPRLAAQVLEVSSMPDEATALGSAQASCEPPPAGPLRDAVLSDLVCSEKLLRAALRRTAAAVGGNLLVAVECDTAVQAPGSDAASGECTARVAHGPIRRGELARQWQQGGGRGSLAERRFSEAVLDAWRIRIDADYTQAAPQVRRGLDPKLLRSRVVPRVPAFDRPLAHVRARCNRDCDEATLMSAVVAGATHLGARHVVLEPCVRVAGEVQCTGVASAPHL